MYVHPRVEANVDTLPDTLIRSQNEVTERSKQVCRRYTQKGHDAQGRRKSVCPKAIFSHQKTLLREGPLTSRGQAELPLNPSLLLLSLLTLYLHPPIHRTLGYLPKLGEGGMRGRQSAVGGWAWGTPPRVRPRTLRGNDLHQL